MNLSIKLLSATAFAVTALSLASCQEEDFGFDANEIAYYDHFVKAFGKADPNQDWNLVRQLAEKEAKTRANTTNTIGNISISVVPEEEWVVFDKAEAEAYKNMLPEEEANLGLVTQNFLVETNQLILYPEYWDTNGGNVIGLYYYVEGPGDGVTTVETTKGETKYIQLVEICDGKPEELQYTAGNVEAKWEYWNTQKLTNEDWNALVSYNSEKYVVSDGSTYAYASGTKLVKQNGNWYTYNGYDGWNYKDVFADLMVIFPQKYAISDGTYIPYWNVSATIPTGSEVYNYGASLTWNGIESKVATDPFSFGVPATALRSKGIKVTLPAKMTVGLYVTQGTYTMYSESELNYSINARVGKGENQHYEQMDACHVATYIDTDSNGDPRTDAAGNPIRYLGFEDWYNNETFDLNDLIFRVYGFDSPGSTIIDKDIVEEEEIIEEGLLVCEDLGDFDFDFNDVVLKLTHYGVKKTTTPGGGGEPTIEYLNNRFEIEAMAAGGTLESYIKYNGSYIGSSMENSGIHKLLNGSAPQIINAGSSKTNVGQKISFEITAGDETYSGKWNKTAYPYGYVDQVFANGYITIEVENGTIIQKIASVSNTGDLAVSANVPQMMLLPVSFLWPQELQTIGTKGTITGVYPDFNQWVTNSGNTSWINTHDTRVTSR